MTDSHCIVVATDLTDESLAVLQALEDVDVQIVTPSIQAVRDALKNAHALIVREDIQVDAQLLDHAPLLRIIGYPATGLTGVDIETASARGIMVMNTPGISAVAAAEHTMALMLALSRRLTEAHNSMRAGYWLLDRKRQRGAQLNGKTLGLIGLGRVGRNVAQRALAFGMTVLAFDPYLGEDQIPDRRIQILGLREMLNRSDFVSIHVPQTRETINLVDAVRLRQMKSGARLINTAFGGVLDEQAAADLLKEGHLAGIALDVYSDEPPYNSPLVGIEGVIHTPHIGDNTIEATQDLSIKIVEQVLDALRDQDYRNVVNLPSVPGTDYETIRPLLSLSERIGVLLHILARSPIRRVEVEVWGKEIGQSIKPVTVALLTGLLKPILGENVSYVNAPILATERGIQVSQAKGLPVGNYANLVACRVTLEDHEAILMTGTLLDFKEPHIMQINDYRMNFIPVGNLLLMGSYDQPGVIGKVGTLMANNDVNIASWHTGRAQPGGHTLTVLTLDEPIAEDVLNSLRAQDFVRHAHQVEL